MSDSCVEITIVPPLRDLGDGFKVRRALPNKDKRMVGPFVFFDQFGPAHFEVGKGLDVRPHPHIGLATVTYLFQGEILHRDSLGTEQRIRPGAMNWMTAGRGIVHSERTAVDVRRGASALAGLQCWVALPQKHEEDEPAFSHTSAQGLPWIEGDGIGARLITGEMFGRRSPVATLSPMVFAEIQLQPGARLPIAADYTERALYSVDGQIDLGPEGIFDAGQMVVLKPGATVICSGAGDRPVRLALIGGEPLDGTRYVTWNFVSSSKERILQAADDWKQRKFPEVPHETEYIPLPDDFSVPVNYP
jgi:redox-sensitive bicupin YhaK (pirin superfamily)